MKPFLINGLALILPPGCVCATVPERDVVRTPREPIDKTSEGADSHTGIYRAETNPVEICVFEDEKLISSGTWPRRSSPCSSSPWSGAEWASPCPGWCPTDPIKGTTPELLPLAQHRNSPMKIKNSSLNDW